MSHVSSIFHIVFCTKHREMTIPVEVQDDLYRYIWKIISDTNSKLIRIGGCDNHIHLLVNLAPTRALSDLVRDIKTNSSRMMKENPKFRFFRGWGKEYFASSVSPSAVPAVKQYIINQHSHHAKHDFDSELMELCLNSGLDITFIADMR